MDADTDKENMPEMRTPQRVLKLAAKRMTQGLNRDFGTESAETDELHALIHEQTKMQRKDGTDASGTEKTTHGRDVFGFERKRSLVKFMQQHNLVQASPIKKRRTETGSAGLEGSTGLDKQTGSTRKITSTESPKTIGKRLELDPQTPETVRASRRRKSMRRLASVAENSADEGTTDSSVSDTSVDTTQDRRATRTPRTPRRSRSSAKKLAHTPTRLKNSTSRRSSSSTESSSSDSDENNDENSHASDNDNGNDLENDSDIENGSDTNTHQDPSYARFFRDLHTSSSSTSNNTLKKLPQIDPKTFYKHISSANKQYMKHAAEKKLLRTLHAHQFPQIFFELCAGFNVLVYGFGSKIGVLKEFADTFLVQGSPVLVVDGFFPSITLKDILTRILSGVVTNPAGKASGSNSTGPGGSVQDQLSRIREYFTDTNRTYKDFYLVINNIDGASLRSAKAQQALSHLATIPNVHMIASIDHVNACMMWDDATMQRFNWVWHDMTTFEGYIVESSFENTLLIAQGDVLGPQAVLHVLKSLPNSARRIFAILAKHQIKTSQDANRDAEATWDGDDGMTFDQFYMSANQQFLVSSEMTFRTQLTEFRDHKMIKSRRGADGSDVLYIPLDTKVLRGLLDDLKNW